ncbi:DUF2589 domain-containing protein [Megamonas sp.]|uniref:DUF2589 domain-containing protein n=1 Tax=Megamonas sp. TaxID=2049033 RepID=UPI00258FBBE0|nr:DUF2589 domain-containing protein [Megamonas sp.]
MANINLSELFTQIGLSMQEAQQKIEQFNYLIFINQFKNVNNSNDENSSILVPKTQQFSFKINDTTQILDVPIITLFNHNNLNLSEVKVSLNIKNFISNNKLLNIEVGSNQNNNESNTNEGTIEIIFKKDTTNEGIARIKQEAIKQF